jgi:tRNA(Ile)-lysidine synthase
VLTLHGVQDLLERIQKSIQSRALLKRGHRLLVAVSGGLDSMVLLDVLDQLRIKSGWRITVAHLNHRLRGKSSDADERLVRKIAQRRGLPIVTERRDVRVLAAREKLSIEMAARKARHEFLAKVARERQIRSVAVAHHADDQVELFFLRLFRGSGSEGLAGMKWRNRSPICKKIELVRPLLDVPKTALKEYALQNKLPFREDATNRSLNIQRNRIRHELLPLLRKHYQAGIARTVLRAAEIVGAEAEYVDHAAREWLKAKVTGFSRLATAVQRRVLQIQLQQLGIAPEFELVDRLRTTPVQAVAVARSATASDHKTFVVFRSESGMVSMREAKSNVFRSDSRPVLMFGGGGVVEFGGLKINWMVNKPRNKGFPKFGPGSEFFDADIVGSRILLRYWRAGDRFQPIGMPVAVKVQDLLVNQKVPKDVRKGLIVATTASGELFWVEKLRISQRFRLTSETKRRLQWRWRRD